MEELQKQIQGIISKLDDFKRSFTDLDRIVKYHKHSGFDSSQLLDKLEYIKFGTGTPENIVSARVGTIYLRQDGGALTTFYVKESGTGSTGWIAK